MYGSNQCCCAGGYLHSVPKHYPARSRLRPHEETGKVKSYAGVSLDRVNSFSIYALHLTTNVYIYIYVCMYGDDNWGIVLIGDLRH